MWSWGKCLLYNIFAQSSAQPAGCLLSICAVLQLPEGALQKRGGTIHLRDGERWAQTCVQKTEKAIWDSILQAFSFQYYWVFLFCLFVRYWLQLTISFNSVLSANCLHLMLYQPKKHPHLLFKTSSKQLLIQGENWVNWLQALNFSDTQFLFPTVVFLSGCYFSIVNLFIKNKPMNFQIQHGISLENYFIQMTLLTTNQDPVGRILGFFFRLEKIPC